MNILEYENTKDLIFIFFSSLRNELMSSEVKLRSAKLAPMVSSGFKEKPITSSSNITKTLTNEQTCEQRNTHLHNLCIQMLR